MERSDINIFALICGAFSVILGVLVIFGWHTDNIALIQINEAFAPMQYNTALEFLLSGTGVVLLTLRWTAPSQALGFATAVISMATLSQYLWNIDLNIDQLLMNQDIMTKTSHPGRMAPNTALCFSLAGLALCVYRRNYILHVSLVTAMLTLSFLALAGYTFNEESIYGWGNLTRMAIHTATGFVILSFGLLSHGLLSRRNGRVDPWDAVPVVIPMIVIAITLFSWYAVKEAAEQRNHNHFNMLVADTDAALKSRYVMYEQSLWGGLGLFYASRSVEREEWEKYVRALNIKEQLPGISGVGYIDYVLSQDMQDFILEAREDGAPEFTPYPNTSHPDKFIIKYIEPVEDNFKALGLDIGFEANRRDAAERARDLGTPALTKIIELVQDNKKQAGFLLLLPVYDTKNTPPTLEERLKHFQGWVYAPFIGPNFFHDLVNAGESQIYFSVYDGEEMDLLSLIYDGATQNMRGAAPGYTKTTTLEFAGRTWTIQWQSSDKFEPPENVKLSFVVAMFGVILAFLLHVSLSYLIRSRQIIAFEVEKRTDELKNANDFQDLVTNSIPDLIFVKDSDFRIVQANVAFLSVYPEDVRDSVIGTSSVESFKEDEAEDFLRFDRIALEEGYSETEETIAFPDGVTRTLFTKKVRFYDTHGEAFVLGVSRDITERKHAELELQRSNHELERFAYIASHDLQEPLRKIGGFTEMLEKYLEDDLDDKAKKYMHFVTLGVARMRELTQGLLAYSCVTTGDIDMKNLDANVIIEGVIDSLGVVIEESGAQIHYGELPVVLHDKVMLTQIFQNLISNSIKYRSERVPEITISARKLNEKWEFSVADNGMGMEKQYLERIFEMFQRLHRREDIPGAGIGLSLCQKIVERYGGTIQVTSEEGEGSTFTFTVPAGKKS